MKVEDEEEEVEVEVVDDREEDLARLFFSFSISSSGDNTRIILPLSSYLNK